MNIYIYIHKLGKKGMSDRMCQGLPCADYTCHSRFVLLKLGFGALGRTPIRDPLKLPGGSDVLNCRQQYMAITTYKELPWSLWVALCHPHVCASRPVSC